MPEGLDVERAWLAVPPLPEEVAAEFTHLDPTDEDDRNVLIRAAHPELADVLDGTTTTRDAQGNEFNPRLHLVIHEVVAQQLIHEDPPEAWATFERLLAAGFDRHEVLHMIGFTISGQIWDALQGTGRPDPAKQVRALRRLPEGWGRSPKAPPPPPRKARRARRR